MLSPAVSLLMALVLGVTVFCACAILFEAWCRLHDRRAAKQTVNRSLGGNDGSSYGEERRQ